MRALSSPLQCSRETRFRCLWMSASFNRRRQARTYSEFTLSALHVAHAAAPKGHSLDDVTGSKVRIAAAPGPVRCDRHERPVWRSRTASRSQADRRKCDRRQRVVLFCQLVLYDPERPSQSTQATGKPKGGWTTKILALTDALGKHVRFVLLPGHRFDSRAMGSIHRQATHGARQALRIQSQAWKFGTKFMKNLVRGEHDGLRSNPAFLPGRRCH